MDLHFEVRARPLMQVREEMFHIPSLPPLQQIEQLNEVNPAKHRKLLVVLLRLGYAADAEAT